MAINVKSGLENYSDEPRFHFDIYAILEGSQELFFGHETQVNVNIVETVIIPLPGNDEETNGDDELEKCYLSPTKRRGVERRALIWAPTGNELLGDTLNCGIPHTCSQAKCPICRVFGGLITSPIDIETEPKGKPEKRPETTLIGRLTHSGGVAIQELGPEEKQRAMHPSMLTKDPGKEPTPTPFKREYNQPGLLYPVYNHCLSMTEREFSAVAYAFMGALARLGAGNPKGVKIYDAPLIKEDVDEPWIVVDRYLAPLGKRPVVSPTIKDVEKAKKQFKAAAFSVAGRKKEAANELADGNFHRYIGDAAIAKLSEYLIKFEKGELNVDAEIGD
ncbi:hypothetical protein C6499_14615 [Candidatus Poribacteria bacterium]|nr:MAG: hypothetical protein C6499_14615 [Candidatus Poribacteria bacterium]